MTDVTEERFRIAFTCTSKQQIGDIRKIGILKTEQDIMDHTYLNAIKARENINLEGMTEEEYVKKYPVKFNPDKGRWDNT